MDIFEEEKADATKLLRFIYQKRKVILSVVTISVVLSIIVTSFISPKYRSFGILFPTNTYNVSNVLNDPRFGYETDADQLIQLLQSSQMRDSIVNEYNLVEYYEIDTSQIEWQQKITQRFIKDISISRTPLMSVVISATTKNPELSANIVNSMIDIVDFLRIKIFKQNIKKAFSASETSYLQQKQKVDSLKASIYKIRNTDDPKNILFNRLEGRKRNMADLVAPYVNTEEMEELVYEYKFAFERLQTLKQEYDNAYTLYNKPFPETYKVDRARPVYLKDSPSFFVNVIIAFLGSLVSIIIFLLVKRRISQIKKTIQ